MLLLVCGWDHAGDRCLTDIARIAMWLPGGIASGNPSTAAIAFVASISLTGAVTAMQSISYARLLCAADIPGASEFQIAKA
jgi:hypothetical protein